jgi:four helix bundle protein
MSGVLLTRVRSVSDLDVFNIAYAQAVRVMHLTESWPRRFGWLAAQMMRSSESVAANIAEGFESQHPKEYMRSLYIARREAGETKVHLTYARDAAMVSPDLCEEFVSEYDRIGRMLWGLIGSLVRRNK